MRVSNFAGSVFKVVHRPLERPASPGIVIGHFTERLEPEHWRHMVEQPAYEHRGRVVALRAICGVNLLTQLHQLPEVKIR